MNDERPVIVLTTIGTADDAGKLAHDLIERRLAACVNVVDPIRSFYRWEGAVQEDGEKLLIIKTVRGRVDALREHLLRIHPYDVPEFIVVDTVDVLEKYAKWLVESCRPPHEPRL